MTLNEQTKGKDGGATAAGPETSANSSQTSAVDAVTSKIEEGKQYSGADVRKLVQDALSADGREQKRRAEVAESALIALRGEHDGLKTQFTTVSDQVSQILRAKDDEEAAKVKDDPVALGSLRARQANRAEQVRLQGVEAEANRKLREAETKISDVNKRETSLNIKLAAMAAGVDEKELADLVPDGNQERLAKTANILKQRGTTTTEETKEIPSGLRTKPASTVSAGGDQRSLSAKLLEKAKAKK